jgi:hypothetical protein
LFCTAILKNTFGGHGCAGSGEGYFFSGKMPNYWRSGFENGNSPSICSLSAKTFNITRKDTAAFAYPDGSHSLPFRTAGVIILSEKKYPSPELVKLNMVLDH